jgi:hypothetical protein
MTTPPPKVTLKNGVECTKYPSHFTFRFACPDQRVNLIEKTRTGQFYPLLMTLNKDTIHDIKFEKPEGESVSPVGQMRAQEVLFTLFMNYFEDGNENLNVLLPLLNTTQWYHAKRLEIHGTFNDRFKIEEDLTIIKIAMFRLELDQGSQDNEDLNVTLELCLAEPMNVLRENTLCLILQKILGRLKVHLSG